MSPLENYKTIKELADELNVSKDKIKYQVRKLPSELPSKINGVTYLNEAAVTIILDSLGVKLPTNDQVILPDNTQDLPRGDTVSILKNELKIKDALLVEKDKQVNKLLDNQSEMQKLLDQQQQLTLQANKQIEQLQSQLMVTYTEESSRESKDEVEQQLSEASKEEIPGLSKKWFQFWK
ncbi:DNA-binding protein [Enterococcus sp. HY326]|uniref:DNA-binding protein n=1 Tax=Enterococcus sp. HY326 TaxID=2971265 RepID=UPI003A102C50